MLGRQSLAFLGKLSWKGVSVQLDEFLKEQAATATTLLATIESIDGSDGQVKITPVVSERCGCGHAVTVPKDVITSVEPTGETVACCGKRLKLVHVILREGATIPLADVLARIVPARRSEPLGPRAEAPTYRTAPMARAPRAFSHRRVRRVPSANVSSMLGGDGNRGCLADCQQAAAWGLAYCETIQRHDPELAWVCRQNCYADYEACEANCDESWPLPRPDW